MYIIPSVFIISAIWFKIQQHYNENGEPEGKCTYNIIKNSLYVTLVVSFVLYFSKLPDENIIASPADF